MIGESFVTDWLASNPVFYNEKTKEVSHNINDVIDYENIEFHPEGFNNYLKFGYSVFQQTPIKNVKFLRHSSKLYFNDDGKICIEYLPDPVEQWLDYHLSESDVIDLIRARVQEWENSVEGDIVVPTSGGYDSRLLNWSIKNKKRLRSFTFGTSNNQAESHEVIYAKKVSEILGIHWQQIELGNYHKYFQEWDRIFGISTHAHGMYQIEFYKIILDQISMDYKKGIPLLSGIIGDAWAGSIKPAMIMNVSDLSKLGYHGINAEVSYSKFPYTDDLAANYFYENKEKINNPKFQIVEMMRFKMILLCYLFKIPQSIGFTPWSPFLNIEIAMAMLNLDENRRMNRLWQYEFFKREGLDVEDMGLKITRENTLNLQAMENIPLIRLKKRIFNTLIDPTYISWVNKNVRQRFFF